MELENLKSYWEELDKKLSENTKLNVELLKKTTKNSLRSELKSPLYVELINIIGVFLGGVIIIIMSIRLLEELRFSIPGFSSTIIGLLYIVFSLRKIKGLLSIEYINSPLIKLRRDLANLNRIFLQTRKYELSLVPLIPILILPLIYKSVVNIDIYLDLKRYFIGVLIPLIFSIPIAFWFNKNVIDRKLNNAANMLDELEKFEKDE
jgi:hypothetical protein